MNRFRERNEFGGMVTGVYTWVWWSMVMSNMKDGYGLYGYGGLGEWF